MWLLDGIAKYSRTAMRACRDLTLDSRAGARRQFVFRVARPNKRMDLKFAADAAARGASVVLWEPGAGVTPPQLPAKVFSRGGAGT